jgi:hypothetical protein
MPAWSEGLELPVPDGSSLPSWMEDQYKIYRGDIASVKKNLLYLTDDNAVRAKIPAHLVESSNWDGYKNLDCEALITEFITAFEEHYGGYFDTHEVEPI